MGQTLVLNNCTVEIRLPPMQVETIDELLYDRQKAATIRLRACDYAENVVLRCGDRHMTVKRLYIKSLVAEMLPVIDEHGNVVRWFTMEEMPLPTTTVEE